MVSSKVSLSHYVPEFTIEINGKETSADVSKNITSITVDQVLNKPNNFSFKVQDDSKGGRFQWLGHDVFKFGNDVTIHMGYVQNMHKLIEGKIQNIKASFSKGLAPTFTVEGSDNAYDFLMGKSDPRVFNKKKDSDIVKEIAQIGKTKLTAVVDETKEVFPKKTKKGEKSYFAFLKELAESNGFEFYLEGRRLFFVKAKREQDPMCTLKWEEELINFQPTLNTANLITEVIVRGWDKKRKKLIEAKAKAGSETKQEKKKQLSSKIAREIYGDVVKVITDRPVCSVQEAKKIAESELDKASDKFIKGSAEIIGNPEIKTAVCVMLEGLGGWFSGKYYIEKVTHSINSSGYRTKFEAKRNSL
ncbi:MAG: phage late control D family protein [Deltaproteobacteria bacterium]|nr:phage late control D family protein [Deltaproteobacteria bacterium]